MIDAKGPWSAGHGLVGLRKVRAAEMYVFGVVVSANNETPIGRASAALRVQLPALFPEHSIEFIDQKEIQALGPERPDEMLFLVFGAAVRMDDDELSGDLASHEVIETIQASVDKIVAATKTRNLN
jgi:hypothetical protein